jgi:hypothetical protein
MSRKGRLHQNSTYREKSILFYWSFQDILRAIRSICEQNFKSKLLYLVVLMNISKSPGKAVKQP